MKSKDSAQPPNYFLSPDMLSITFIHLNGSNYAQWAQAVEVFLLGRKKFDYMIKEPLVPTDPKASFGKREWKEMKRIILEYSFFPLFGSFNGGNAKLIPLFGSLSGREWNK